MINLGLKFGFLVPLVLSSLVLSGCRTVTTFHKPNIEKIDFGKLAVIPFENESSSPEAGRVVSKLFSTELQAKTTLAIMPDHEIRNRIGLEEVKPGSPRYFTELGKKLGVSTLVTGTITEYRYRRSLGEAPVVGITVRMIDVTSGNLLWGAAIADEGWCFLNYRGSLSELAQKQCRYLVKKFNRNYLFNLK